MIDSGFAASTPHHNTHTARRIKERIHVESEGVDEGSEEDIFLSLGKITLLYFKCRFLVYVNYEFYRCGRESHLKRESGGQPLRPHQRVLPRSGGQSQVSEVNQREM